jgi:hypothetical protein
MTDEMEADDSRRTETITTTVTPRDELRADLEQYAKGGDVFSIGSGLAFVPPNQSRVKLEPTELVEDHGWAVGGIYPNFADEEVGLFVFPLTDFGVDA